MGVEWDIDPQPFRPMINPMTKCHSSHHNEHLPIVQAEGEGPLIDVKKETTSFVCTDRHVRTRSDECLQSRIHQLGTDTKITQFDFTCYDIDMKIDTIESPRERERNRRTLMVNKDIRWFDI